MTQYNKYCFVMFLLVCCIQVSAITMEDLVEQGRAGGSFPDYSIPGLEIAENETLILEPNTNLIFTKYRGIVIKGNLIAEGTKNKPITFVGKEGDFDFGNIIFEGPNTRTTLNNCMVFIGKELSFKDKSKANVINSTIISNKGIIFISHSEPILKSNNISIKIPHGNKAFLIEKSKVTLEDNSILFDTPQGIVCNDSEIILKNNTVENIRKQAPLINCVKNCEPTLLNNSFYFYGNRHWDTQKIRWDVGKPILCNENYSDNQFIDTSPYNLRVSSDKPKYKIGEIIRLNLEPENREMQITYANDTKTAKKYVEFIAQKNKRQIKAELDGELTYYTIKFKDDLIFSLIRLSILFLIIIGAYIIIRLL